MGKAESLNEYSSRYGLEFCGFHRLTKPQYNIVVRYSYMKVYIELLSLTVTSVYMTVGCVSSQVTASMNIHIQIRGDWKLVVSDAREYSN